ncbi:hypothetical protein CAMSH0001_1243 [Campylobacter showae RM3277]|uniref:Uncharacterized protein n=1 Tax=Campylobacter showae RM3277 TaxID=553219 RepID=C6RDT5_9BACT|nr:hypothetical protein CAMSH0001_1243 [Campylobacter showae RM3277]
MLSAVKFAAQLNAANFKFNHKFNPEFYRSKQAKMNRRG